MTPDDVEALLLEHGAARPPDGPDGAAETWEARERRVALLVPVLSTCQAAWASRPEELHALAQKLGDGSRDVAWRRPFGESGLLELFLRILAGDRLGQGLKVHALRLVGNSCADTDENRARVVAGNLLASVTRQLADDTLIPFTVPVLYNILVDYEPAQRLASQSRLSSQLVALLASPVLSKYAAFVPYFCKTLALLASHDDEAAVADPATPTTMLRLATSPPFCDDVDDFSSLVAVAAAYLASERFQARLVEGNHVGLFVEVLYRAHAYFDPAQLDDQELATQLKQLRASLLTTLADLSANDAFSRLNPLTSPLPQAMLAWIRGPDPGLQAAACLALGNLSRSDEASVALVDGHQIHVPLARLLFNPAADSQLLHSVLSFLKNLAIPAQNKAKLEHLLDPACVPRLFSLDALPQVQFAAVSLTRLLLVNCPQAVRRLCTPLSADPSSPSHERTSVSNLVSLFDRSDAEPARLEAARAVATLCRVLHSPPAPLTDMLPDWDPTTFAPPDDADADAPAEHSAPRAAPDGLERRRLFYATHSLSKPLAFLITQQNWPSVRSEAWFVFALMSRSKDGARVAMQMLMVFPAMTVLTETITGREWAGSDADSPAPGALSPTAAAAAAAAAALQPEPQGADAAQRARLARVDRENALVLCSEILRNWGAALPGLRLSLLQDLVDEGTALVAADRNAQ